MGLVGGAIGDARADHPGAFREDHVEVEARRVGLPHELGGGHGATEAPAHHEHRAAVPGCLRKITHDDSLMNLGKLANGAVVIRGRASGPRRSCRPDPRRSHRGDSNRRSTGDTHAAPQPHRITKSL